MWRKLSLLMCICLLFVSCRAGKEETETADISALPEPAAVETPVPAKTAEPAAAQPAAEPAVKAESAVTQTADDDDLFEHPEDPQYWTIARQQEKYEQYFSSGDLSGALGFRNFIESLAQYHHNEPVYEYNPVFLCYEKYPDIIPLIFQEKPDLFTRGNIDFGTWSKAPIVYVLQNLGLEEVKFYFENDIPFLDVREELLFGTMNRGGPRFGIGGNILTYAKEPDVIEYMISQGIPAEVKASDFSYYLKGDTLDVHSTPGYDTDVVGTLTGMTRFNALSVLTYEVDGTQWMKISFDDKEGWIPQSGFDYSSGI